MLVQLGNNWIQKIPLTAKLGCPRNFFSSRYFQIGQHVVLLHIQIPNTWFKGRKLLTWFLWLELLEHKLFSVSIRHVIKTKNRTIQWIKSTTWDTIDDWYINKLDKNQVICCFSIRAFFANLSPKLTELCVETPCLCPSGSFKVWDCFRTILDLETNVTQENEASWLIAKVPRCWDGIKNSWNRQFSKPFTIRPHSHCAHLRIERSVFEPWPGTHVVLLGKKLNSGSSSPHPGV